jgi:hypothetical protein
MRKTILLWTFATGCAFGQAASIEGYIADQSGARIAGAEVALIHTATGWKNAVRSGADGTYRFPKVAPGILEIRAHHPGFSTANRKVEATSGGVIQVNIVLPVAEVVGEMMVAASAELLQPAQATQSAKLSSEQMLKLPTATRNYTHLIVAEAGVAAPLPDRTGRGLNVATSPGAQAADGTQSLNPSVNGARPTNNSLSINGVDATNMMNGGGSLGNNITVPLDAIEEVEVQTALYSATSGRNGGGNIQMFTRHGTNEFHGSVSHFLQNEFFNANEFFLNRNGRPRPKFRRQESFGGVGGPVVKNKTFFYLAVQRTRFDSGFANRAIANTAIPEGLGDVRTRESIAQVANQWLQSGANGNPLFAQNFLDAIRRFPAEQVPGLERKFFQSLNPPVFRALTAEDIHPVAINVLNQKRGGRFLLPSADPARMPLLPPTSTFGAERELIQSFPTFFNSWSGSASIEHHFSANDRLRLGYVKSSQFVEEAFGWANSSPSPTQGQTPGYVASLSHLHTFGPRWVNELRGGFFELHNTRISKFRDITNATLGIYNPLEHALGGLASLMPTIDISTQRSTSGIGNAWDYFDRQRNIYANNIVTHSRGVHSIHFGGELRRINNGGEYMARTNGDLDYDNWVLFFTGHGASGGGSDLDQGDTRRNFNYLDYGFFVQNDWRLRRGLTVNLGLRWDYYGWPTEAQGRIGTYYTQAAAAKAGVKPGFHIAAKHLIHRPNFDPLAMGLVVSPYVFPLDMSQVHKAQRDSIFRPDRNNFAPRIGFAWQPPQLRQFVFRGGYGIFYERPTGSFKTDLQLSAPFFIYQNVPAPLDMANPYPRININPFAIPLNVTIARDANGGASWRRFDGTPFPATEPFNAKNFSFIDPFIVTPYVQQWTFNLQWEPFKGNLIDTRYVGTRGVKLNARLNLAQPLDPRETGVNGFTDIRTRTGALINPDFFVPSEFLGLGRANGFRLRSNWGQSTYHALQTSYRRRLQKGLLAHVSYTWSKTIDVISSDGGVVEHNARHIANNRGVADFDRTHRFTAAFVYKVPAPFRGGFAKRALNGWSINGMVTAQSGAPFSVLGSPTANAYWAQVARVRPSLAPGRTIESARKSGRVQDRLTQFFDPTAFVNSGDQWGNAGRNILRGPAQRQVDLALAKDTLIRERFQVELRWEAFNALNQPTFGNPSALTLPTSNEAIATSNVGQITTTIGGPRTMQMALRVRF